MKKFWLFVLPFFLSAGAVLAQPVITGQPTSNSKVGPGTNAILHVVASGSSLTYQWQMFDFTHSVETNLVDNATVHGSKSAALTINGYIPPGGYGGLTDYNLMELSCLVSNASGTMLSSPAVLNVEGKPIIGLQPTNVIGHVGDAVADPAFVFNTVDNFYQWRHNGAAVSGQNNYALTIASLQPADAGTYDVVVTNAGGSVTSSQFTLSASKLCADQPDGLVSWWKGEFDASDSVGSNPFSVTSVSVGGPTGEVGQGFGFTNTNPGFMQASGTGLPSGSSARTIELWANLSGVNNNVLLAGYGAFQGGFGDSFGISLNSGSVVTLGNIGGFPTATFTTTAFPTGVWTHVVGIYDGTSMLLYLNGVQQNTPSALVVNTPANPTVFVGGLSTSSMNINGNLDEIRIYNRALTATEIAANYAAGTNGLCALQSKLKDFLLVKGQIYSQTNNSAPAILPTNGYAFLAEADFSYPYNYAFSGTLKFPSGAQRTMFLDFDKYILATNFNSLSVLNGAIPNGTYSFIFQTSSGTASAGVLLTGDKYPNAPHFNNSDSFQAGDATQPMTFAWDAFTNGTILDYVDFEILDRSGNSVVKSGDIGTAGSLNGTALSYPVDANALMNGCTYTAQLTFGRFSGSNSSGIPGASGVAGYFKRTSFVFTPAAPDHSVITDFGVVKGVNITQNGANSLLTNNFLFHVLLDSTGNEDAVTNGFLKLPSGVIKTPSNDGEEGPFDASFSSQAGLNVGYPNGLYTLTLQTKYMGTRVSSLNVTGDAYPTAPHFQNYDQIQNTDARQDFTYTWDPFVTTNANDIIIFDILDDDGDMYVGPFQLPASTTSYTVPGGSTPAGDPYTVELTFVHLTASDTNTIPGVPGLGGYFKRTSIPYNTLLSGLRYYEVAKGVTATQTAANTVNNGAFTFRAAAGARNFLSGELNSGVLYLPTSGTKSLCQQTYGKDPALLKYEDYSNKNDLDNNYQNGIYELDLDASYYSFTGVVATVTGDAYPNTPHLINFSQAQVLNPALDFTLTWDAFTNGTSSDVIQLVITDTNGFPVFESGLVAGDAGPLLDGTATSCVIPAYTLPGGQAYSAKLIFRKITDFGSYTPYGGRPLIGYFAETSFPITVLSSAGAFPVAQTLAKEYTASVDHDCNNFLVAMQGANDRVKAQFINSSGNPAMPIIDVGYYGSAPLVSFDGSRHAMVWSGPYSDDGGDGGPVISSTGKNMGAQGGRTTVGSLTSSAPQIIAQIIHPNGSLDSVYTLSSTNGAPVLRGVANNGDRFLAVWEQDSATTNARIYGRIFDSFSGTTGSPILLSSGRSSKYAAVMSDGTDFFVAWQTQDNNAAGKWNVVGRWIEDRDGIGLDGIFTISQTNSALPGPISLTWGTTNGIIAWSRATTTTSGWDLSARVMDDFENFNRPQFVLSAAAGDQTTPNTSFDGSSFLVDWLDANSVTAPNTNAQIKAKFIASTGGADSAEFSLFQSLRGKVPVIAPIAFDGSRYFITASYASTASAAGSLSDSDIFGTFLNVTIPMIIANPQSKFVAVGDTINLNASVSGQPPLQFQWLFNGTNIAGATDTALNITNASVANSGDYTLRALNAFGTAISLPGTVIVLARPVITSQPVGATNVPLGTPFTLNVTATGGSPLQYQWRLNGTTIPGATETTYSTPDIDLSKSGVYSVSVQNPVGAVSSIRTVVLAQGTALSLTDNFPGGLTNNAQSGSGVGNNFGATSEANEPAHGGRVGGSSVWFNWKATADGIVTFNTLGSSFDTLIAVYVGNSVGTLTRLVGDDDSAGFFASKVSFNATNGVVYHIAIDGRAGAQGNIVLSWQFENTDADVPVITQSPSNQTAVVNQPVTFSVVAQSRTTPSYQWYFNDNFIQDATNSTLTYNSASSELAGVYYAIVTSGSGRSSTSASATLEIASVTNSTPSEDKFADVLSGDVTIVAYKPHFSRDPHGNLVPVSAGALGTQLMNNFGATKEDGEPDHAGISGGSSRWFSLEALDSGTMIVDTIGSDFDTVLAVYTGTNLLTLKSVTSDDNSAPDGVRSQVTFQATNGVTYLVAIDGVNGVQGNIVLNWRLGNLPVITQTLTNQLVKAGTNLILAISATNDPVSVPISYQWQFNGANIPGATDASLAVNNFSTANAGKYRAIASNYVGVASSSGVVASGPPVVTITAPSTGFYTKGPTNIVISAASFGLDLTKMEFYQGATKIGTDTTSPYSMTWSNVAAGVYKLTARATDILGKVGTSAVVNVVVDNAKPVVAVTLPAKGARSVNANVTVSGTVTDNDGIGSLVYQLNSDSPVTMPIATNKWSVPVTCTPGTNYFRVKAIDLAGNESVMVTNNFFYVVSNLFILNTNGNGTVAKSFTGTMLELGRGYTLTAKPANTQTVFSNWDGYMPSSNNLVLNFIMSPGLAITANFVTNPFPAVKGTYNGLFYETNQVKLTSAGLFTFTVSDKGVLSGKLISGATYTMTGAFDASGHAVLSIPRAKQSNLVANIQLDLDNQSDIVTGSLADPGWNAVMDGDRAITNATSASVNGTYTVVVPGAATMGDSYVTATVKTNGALTTTGLLADGTTTAPITESTGIARSGRWPFFANLYTGKGFMIGWVNVTNATSATVSGDVNWIKSTNSPASKFYTAGFTNDTAAIGSLFAVTNKNSFLDLPTAYTNNASILLTGGNLPGALNDILVWNTNNIVKAYSLSNSVLVPSTNKLTLTITPASGTFNGTFVHPLTKVSTKISGALMQQTVNGAGFFPGTNQTGKVSIAPIYP